MKPSVPLFENLPDELTALPQWVIWLTEAREGRPTKVPYDAKTGERASSTDPKTWSTFSQARRAYDFGNYDGVGFVFTASDPFVGVDLDKCRNPETGTLAPWAEEIVQLLDSYSEPSVSGCGVHIIVKAKLPDGSRKRYGQIEMYESERFFVMTGGAL